jgi:2-oxoglutarate ferredoxin oxidoreductase subunit alpha
VAPYDWSEKTGLSPRAIPGQRGGEYVLTGLAHTRWSKVAYDPVSNQKGCDMRSRKLATLRGTLAPPRVHGDPEGDLLVVGWGSTLGAIEEAVDRLRARGEKVSSLHLRFLLPLEVGLREIFARFGKVLTVEINYSDDAMDPAVPSEFRRYPQLATLLRGQTLCDVDGWSLVPGQPLSPGQIVRVIEQRRAAARGDGVRALEGDLTCSA